MKIFNVICLGFCLTGCASSWPKVNILGDDYYISPFGYDTEIAQPNNGGATTSSPVKQKIPVNGN
jgi:hypothetical protein